MAFCANCGSTVRTAARFCERCGSSVGDSSESPTAILASSNVSARGINAASAVARGGFAPGQILAERYRIIGLLGRGGMGEVYRADDLKLGQSVALKFLPPELARDVTALDRLHAEVRTARQVSHPHVCRVYDIGEVDGHPFLTMEYVDGEDLGTLLRRIGRLPPAKAIEISRQLAAGLAAAHDQGVLHRDLKPANVMVDGYGRARITDFGLAIPHDQVAPELAGTPAYMAPEMHSGGAATVQSDLYALGLVMYEMFTGKKAFDATILSEWRKVHTEDRPTSPSDHTTDMDPVVERLILRCLEKDPGSRPRSASQVGLALPGGDPLAAAIAAGETPSPEMVAAAGGEGSLRPLRAWLVLAAFLVVFGLIAAITPYSTDSGIAPMEQSPAGLLDRARATIARFGYENPADDTSWLERDYPVLRWFADNRVSTEWRRDLKRLGAPILLHYRGSPKPLVAGNNGSLVTASDPAPDLPGMVDLTLDARGRVRSFSAVPSHWSSPGALESSFPESLVFDVAGLDPARFERKDTEWLPPVPFDERREWSGTRQETPDIPMRMVAATLEGKLVAVAVHGPWSTRSTTDPLAESASLQTTASTLAVMFLVTMGTAVYFARKNLRLGRGDRKGVKRIAAVAAVLGVSGWLATAHLTRQFAVTVLQQVFPMLGEVLFICATVAMLYVAIEPYLRQKMPQFLVGWARLLEGRVRDPRIGRDVLLGMTLGAVAALFVHVANGLPTFFPFPHQTTQPSFGLSIPSRLAPLAAMLEDPLGAILRALSNVALLFVLRLVLRRARVAVVVFALVLFLLNLGAENPALEFPSALCLAVLLTITTARLGLLSTAAYWYAYLSLVSVSIRPDVTGWAVPFSVAGILLMLGMAFWSFRTSLGGRSPFGAASLDA